MVKASHWAASVPLRIWVGCAAAGLITGVLLRIGLNSGEAQPLVDSSSEAAKNLTIAIPSLPPSLKALESELQRTLAASHKAESAAKERRSLLADFAERLDPADFAEAAHRGLELPSEERRIFLTAVIRRWAEHNGANAIAFAMSRAPEELRSALTSEALDHWSTVQASAALQWILQHSENEQRTEYLHRFIRTVGEKDPALALSATDQLPKSEERGLIREQLAQRLAETDLSGAITALLHEWSGDPRGVAADLAERWLEKDPAGALAWAAQIRDAQQSRIFEDRLATAWTRRDLKGALEWVQSQPSSKRIYLLHCVLQEWTGSDPKAAREYVLALPPGPERSVGITTVASALGVKHRDIRGFLEMHQQLESPQDQLSRPELLFQIIAENRGELREGAELLRELPQTEKNQRLLDRYLARWFMGEPEKVMQYLKDNNLLEKMPEAARSYALQLTQKDMDAALTWAAGLPPGTTRDYVHCAITYGLATKDPERAATMLEREVPAELQPSTTRLVIGQWYEKDPQRATAWAQSLSNEAARTVACAEVVGRWGYKDPTGPVAQWIESLPPGPTYDVAVATYAGNIGRTDPAAALEWVSTIRDPQLRQLQVESQARVWLLSNRADATQWIQESQVLSAEVKQWLLRGRE